jgi:hypothetical protein
MHDLMEWAKNHENPADDNQLYAPFYQYAVSPNPEFRIFMTTNRLLSNTKFNTHLLADATHKLTNEGYPLLTCGTTDKAKQFHLLCVCLTHREKEDDFEFMFKSLKNACVLQGIYCNLAILVSDSASAITKRYFKLNLFI